MKTVLPLIAAFVLACLPALAAQSEDTTADATAETGIVPAAGNDAATAGETASDEAGGDAAYGAFQRGHYLTAFQLALPRAKLGDPAAQTLIAEIYSRGLGLPKNNKEAAFWYESAAEGGDTAAQLKYALMLLEGRYVAPDPERAKELMRLAADAGNSSAQFNYGQILITAQPGRDGVQKALPYMTRAAESGIADAQFALAQIYAYGTGLDEADPQQARAWLIRAARSGFDTAQLDLAVWLIDGIGGKIDYEAGFGWMRRAANTGNVMAQNRLSHLYINAIGTRPDPIEAAKWYILSRRAGLEDHSLEDFFQGLTADEQKAGIEAANNFRSR
ncbi:tetratricopeptide repeat protein [Hoeflea sp. TYP-13]|uniref:tetratricopeptide repeat protein n=1 Tax=Hoeflea sp. TYP-13 TaxID=3230023 RepID=UPI0034C6D2A0